jgi:hypothetical protein
MPSARYVYIKDNGDVFSTADDPTAEDLSYVDVGMMTILRLADGRSYGRASGWIPIPTGALGRVEIDGHLTVPFHSLASF